jgi:hypothetical protein
MKQRCRDTSGKSAKVEPNGTQAGNGVETYGDKDLMERHQHGPDPVGAGKIVKTES